MFLLTFSEHERPMVRCSLSYHRPIIKNLQYNVGKRTYRLYYYFEWELKRIKNLSLYQRQRSFSLSLYIYVLMVSSRYMDWQQSANVVIFAMYFTISVIMYPIYDMFSLALFVIHTGHCRLEIYNNVRRLQHTHKCYRDSPLKL